MQSNVNNWKWLSSNFLIQFVVYPHYLLCLPTMGKGVCIVVVIRLQGTSSIFIVALIRGIRATRKSISVYNWVTLEDMLANNLKRVWFEFHDVLFDTTIVIFVCPHSISLVVCLCCCHCRSSDVCAFLHTTCYCLSFPDLVPTHSPSQESHRHTHRSSFGVRLTILCCYRLDRGGPATPLLRYKWNKTLRCVRLLLAELIDVVKCTIKCDSMRR